MKRMKKMVVLLLLSAVAWVLGLSVVGTVETAYASGGGANNMNVVFVLDGSGSMYTTDKDKLRFEALELFLGLSTESGNYMGAVVFDDGIILQQEIVPINDRAAKSALSQEVKRAESNGDTDIGSAILTAVRMLKESGSPDLPSAMILLSDGNTDLPKDKSGKKLEESLHRKAAAIDYARQKDIPVHSVCLNANGKARPEELREISDATGGTCVEVKRAEDLKDVFNQFYNIIYSTKTMNLVDTKIPRSGELKVPFSIPVIGVKEANIIINTLNADTSYNLFSPKGYGYTRAELDAMAIKAKTFTVIKIQKPQPGDWELVVRGARRDQVKIDMVYNTDLSMKLEAVQTQAEGQKAAWELSAQVWNEGEAVSDAAVYQKYPFWIVVTDKASGESEKLELSQDADKSLGQYAAEGYGKYKVQAFCEIDGMKVKSNALTLQKKNTAPVWKDDPVVVDKKIHLFSKSLLNLDLNDYAYDEQDAEEWLHFQEEYAKTLEQKKETGRKQGTDGKKPLQLLTVHGAKGLEYDRVWIPDCNEKIFPHGTMPEESAVEEERRIFYVAMTRAKKNLELLYLTGTKERPRQPSRFLNPLIERNCPVPKKGTNLRQSSVSSSNSQPSRYSSKASATFSYSSSSSI